MIATTSLRRFLVDASAQSSGGFTVEGIGIVPNGDGSVCIINTLHERAGHLAFTVLMANGMLTASTWKLFPDLEALGRVIDEQVPSVVDPESGVAVEVHRVQNGDKCISFRMDFVLPHPGDSETHISTGHRFWKAFEEFYAECAGTYYGLGNLEQLERMDASQMPRM